MCSGTGFLKPAAAAFFIWVACASDLFGQTGPARPNHPVFGEAEPAVSGKESADVSVSIEDAYETNALGDANGSDPGIFRAHGFYSTLKTDADYVRNRDHFKVAATAGSNVRYYPDLGKVVPVNGYVGAGFTADHLHLTTFSLNQTIAYTPSFLTGLFPALVAPVPGAVSSAGTDYTLNAGTDYTLNTFRSNVYATTASLTQRLSSRATAGVDSGFSYTDFTSGAASKPLKSYDVHGYFAYRVNRTATVRLGYIYKEGQYWSGPGAREDGFDIGVDLNRALSRSRRATFSFNVGSALINGPAQPDVSNALVPRHQYRVVGSGAVSYDIGNTWRARGSYRRGLQFVEGMASPVFINGYAAEVGGFVNGRTDILASGGYSTGEGAIAASGSAFSTYTGDIRLRYAVARNLAFYVEYSYYSYRFVRGFLVTPGFDPLLSRNGIHVGLTLWTGTRRK
jgi:hypothetical protein